MKSINLTTQNKILLFSFCAFFLVYIFSNYKNIKSEKPQSAEKFESADTFIPAGHVLVPIEIENVDSVSGLIGAFALVDLYYRSDNNSPEMLMAAQKIKLIRAPLNPNQYAVLVTEKESADLLKFNPRFWVTLHNQKNHKSLGGVFNNSKKMDKVSDLKTEVKSEISLQKLKTNRVRRSKKRFVKEQANDEDVIIEYYEPKKARYL